MSIRPKGLRGRIGGRKVPGEPADHAHRAPTAPGDASKRMDQNVSAHKRKWSLKAREPAFQLTHDLSANLTATLRDWLFQDQTEGSFELLA
jgi:hypothetical protein